MRGGILTLLRDLAAELGERFPFREDELDEIGQGCGFEELVNRIAADIDVPPLRKQALLQEALPDRGLSVLSILRSRQLVIDRLRPFRHLASNNQFN